jgi:hypothetical protein
MPSKATKSVGRRGREVGQGQGELWEKANSNAVVGTYLGGVQSYMHVKWQYTIFSRPAEQNTFRSVYRQCIKKNIPRERYSLKREISGTTS